MYVIVECINILLYNMNEPIHDKGRENVAAHFRLGLFVCFIMFVCWSIHAVG